MQRFTWILCAIAMASLASVASAQSPTGTLQGVVTDTQGAAIPGATVTIVQTTTNERKAANTDSSGRFTFPFLTPGLYNAAVEAHGFETMREGGIAVLVTETRSLTFALKVGSLSQTVQVTASAEALNTQSSTISETIPSSTILQLPDLNRDIFDFAMLVPGVNNGVPGSAESAASTPHISGSRNANNEVLIDGMTDILPENNVGNNELNATPVEDSVQEINVQTSVPQAEYGRFSGGLESLITKSGTNNWHGSYFEYIQEGALDAVPFGAPGVANTQSKPDMHQYTSGGTVGGPIVHNRAFFFFDYQNIHTSNGEYFSDYVPDPALFNGDFTSLFGTSTPALYDPDSVYKVATGPLAGTYARCAFGSNASVDGGTECAGEGGTVNMIPANRISPVTQAVLKYFPQPNITGAAPGQNNYQTTLSVPDTDWRFDTRVDADITPKWRSFLRYTMEHSYAGGQNTYKDAASNLYGPNNIWVYSGILSNTVTFSPTFLGEFRYGLSRQTENTAPDQTANLGGLGFDPGFLSQVEYPAFPTFTFSGANNGDYSQLGPQGWSTTQEDPLAQDVNANLVKIVRGHTFSFGGEFRDMRLNFWQDSYPSGAFSADDSWTREFPQTYDGATGDALASLLMGLPSSGEITVDPKFIATSQYAAFYAQDSWRVTPKLTLNYGLRYSFEIPRAEQHNQLSFWNPTAVSPLQAYSSQIEASVSAAGETCPYCGNLTGAMTLVGQPGALYGRRQAPVQKRDFGPRFGFAYSPNAKMVLRGGIGVIFQPSAFQASGSTGGSGSAGFSTQTYMQTTSDSGTTPPVASLYSPDPALPASARTPFPNGYAVPQGDSASCLSSPACVQGIGIGDPVGTVFNNYRNPYTIEWNANVQFAMPWGIKAQIAYLGNRGLFLPTGGGVPLDQLTTGTLTANGCTVGATTGQCKLSQYVPNPFESELQPGSPFYTTGGYYLGSYVLSAQLQSRWPQYDTVESYRTPQNDSRYNAVTLSADKAMSNGLSFISSFTDGMEYDNGSSAVTYLGPVSGTYANQYNPKGEWSVGAQNIQYDLALGFVYMLPIGHGHWLLNSGNTVAEKLAGGWQVSGIENWMSGNPVLVGSVDNGTTEETYLGFGQRPNQVGNPKLPNRTYKRWFDPGAFQMPLSYQIGNASPTLSNVNNPGYQDLDLLGAKNIKLGQGKYNIQLRVEMYNAFNHPSLGAPDAELTDATFGQVQSYEGSARRLQFAGKLSF